MPEQYQPEQLDQQYVTKDQLQQVFDDRDRMKGEGERDIEERREAFAALKEKYPDFDQEDFEKYMEDQKVDTISDLYNLYYNAKKGADTGGLRKQVMKDIETENAAQVETGELNSAVDIPENIDTEQSMDDMFEAEKEKYGVDTSV